MSTNKLETDGETVEVMDGELRNRDSDIVMEWDWGKDAKEKQEDLGKARDLIKCLAYKRKLRLDLDVAKAQSASASPNANVAVLDLTWDEEEARSVKRIKEAGSRDVAEEVEDRSASARMASKIRKVIRCMDKEIRGAAEVAKERNTKRELKDGVQRLRCLIAQIMSQEAQVLLQSLGRNTGQDAISLPDPLNDKCELEGKQNEIRQLKQAIVLLESENKKLKDVEMEKMQREIADLRQQNEHLS